jgi:hypothetical protein
MEGRTEEIRNSDARKDRAKGVSNRAYNTVILGIPVIFSGIQIPALIQKCRFFGTNLKIIVYDLFTQRF